jgi:hypothetical protein
MRQLEKDGPARHARPGPGFLGPAAADTGSPCPSRSGRGLKFASDSRDTDALKHGPGLDSIGAIKSSAMKAKRDQSDLKWQISGFEMHSTAQYSKLHSMDQVVARVIEPQWMEKILNNGKTCEITASPMGKMCRSKTHFLMHPNSEGRKKKLPNLIANLRADRSLGPYGKDETEVLVDDSVRLGFLIGMTKYELKLFISKTAKKEVHLTLYTNIRVCTDITWVDEHDNNNNGFLTGWNTAKNCTRFCFAHEIPRHPTPIMERRGGPLPARWRRVTMLSSSADSSPYTLRHPPGRIARRSRPTYYDLTLET